MNYEEQNIIRITWRAKEHWDKKHITDIPFAELEKNIIDLAEKFEKIYPDSDWFELDYNDEINKFTDKELARDCIGIGMALNLEHTVKRFGIGLKILLV